MNAVIVNTAFLFILERFAKLTFQVWIRLLGSLGSVLGGCSRSINLNVVACETEKLLM